MVTIGALISYANHAPLLQANVCKTHAIIFHTLTCKVRPVGVTGKARGWNYMLSLGEIRMNGSFRQSIFFPSTTLMRRKKMEAAVVSMRGDALFRYQW